jgi:hypothetical protein
MNQRDRLGEEFVLQQMADWGYYIFPKTHPESLGYSGLLVAMRDEPTGMHFDPVALHLWLCQSELAEWTVLGLVPPVQKSTTICPGRLVLCDYKGKRTEFFTFGGSLESISVPGETVYSVHSSAPILPITNALWSVADLFTFEVEGTLARSSAKWGLSHVGYLRHLAHTDPLQLYLACLDATLSSFEESRALREAYWNLYHALLTEKRWLLHEDRWPAALPSLNDLLSPDSNEAISLHGTGQCP